MDKLADYRGKRDASRTPEPVPPAPGESTATPESTGTPESAAAPENVVADTGAAAQSPAAAGIFVIQEHHARRLHWDFRLERDGVLVSWAMPKGVPDDPAVNHLAVRTEDHPLEYAQFAGEIPRGEYGGGTVAIWDHGTYEVAKWDDREVKVVLRGSRVSGGYALFCADRSGGKDWIIHRERLPLPAAMSPMLAVTGAFPARDPGAWAVEMKWDGVRALAFIEAGRLTLRSRTGKDITGTYPELAGLGNAIGRRQALVDGEIVAFNSAGQPDFQALQPRMHVTDLTQARRLAGISPVTYLAFDLIQLDGRPLAGLPYRERRDMLTPLIPNGTWFLCPPSFPGEDFPAVLAASAANGLEGVVAKRLDSRYEPGVRCADWVKVKNVLRQEVVVAGWKPGKGNREGMVGSLLIGVHSDEGFVYCGHVGTGFTAATLRMLGERLEPLRSAGSPFDGPVPPEHARPAIWVQPRLVIEVAFERWTRSGRMRAPAYKGLREDKDPEQVVRET
jgi:bifunctional non-homologous end joining protein LigD